jgi:hypothetical protein
LKRAYAKRHDSHKREPTQPTVPIVASGREIQLSLDRDELLGLMQDSLESLALKLGLLIASSLLEDEVARLCGRRYEHQPHRTHTRYGHQRGMATLAGQKMAIARPRMRRTDGGGEVPLETYARLQSPEAMPEAVLRRMVRGVITRDYADGEVAGPDQLGCGIEPAGGPGGDADGGATGCARGVAADPGDNQSDRECAERDSAGDGPCDAVA